MHLLCGSCGLAEAEAPILSFQHGCWGGNKVKRGAAPCTSPAWSQHWSRAGGHCQGGKSLTWHSVAPQPSLACPGHDTGCSFGLDKVPAGLLTPGKTDLCSTAGASPAAAAKPGCLARAAPCRRAARPPRRSWQRGARRTRGQRRWEAITSPLRPALIPSHGAQGAGSPNKAQSG